MESKCIFTHFILYRPVTQAHSSVQNEYQFVSKILFLIVAICEMIVVCMNLCINEAMRRQTAYRLAWEQRIVQDQLHTTDNVIN